MILGGDFVPMPFELSFECRRRRVIDGPFDKFIFEPQIFAEIYELPVGFARKDETDVYFILDARSDAEKINLRAAPFQIVPDVKYPFGFTGA